jgi:hypothetical protein
MHDLSLPGVRERAGDLHRVAECVAEGQRAVGVNKVADIRALDELEHDITDAAVFADEVRPGDVGMIGRQAVLNFAKKFEASEGAGGAQIAGTGSRSKGLAEGLRFIGRDFTVDDGVWANFRAFLDARKIAYTDAELEANREPLARLILEEVLRQVFGEGEARRRTMAWDPQVKKALEVIPRDELLLKDPRSYVLAREAERRVADAGLTSAGRP